MDERMQELDRAIQAASADQKRLKQISAQLDDLYRQQAERREKLDEAAQNLRKDAKKADVVAHKPGLVEKQINNSFNKFAVFHFHAQ